MEQVMLASPVMAADVKETVRPAVCAANPTAKSELAPPPKRLHRA
jgi:hypothetical protein